VRRNSGQGSAAADAAMAAVIAQLEAEIVALDQAIEDVIGQNEDPGTIGWSRFPVSRRTRPP
jgi:hypothetical protein